MSLDVALQNALSGLRATQTQIQVISGNIANVQTPGYSRENVPIQSEVTPTGGAGVITGTVQRVTNRLLANNLTAQMTTTTAAATRDSYMQQIQAQLGQVGGGDTLNDALNTFTSAMQQVATTPEDPVAQGNAVNAAQSMAQKLHSLSAAIQMLRQNADNDIATAVDTVNTALNTIYKLNNQISQLSAMGQSTAALQDQRDQAVNQVAQLIGIHTVNRPDGTVIVTTSTGQMLVDSNVDPLGYTASGTVSATTPVSPITWNGTDITNDVTTGKIGALLKLRDTDLPGITAQLNQFTNNLFTLESTPALNTTDSGYAPPATSDVNHIFANVNLATGVDNASSIQVNKSLLANPDLLHTGASGADPSISQTLAGNLAQSVTFAPAGGFVGPLTTTLSDYSAQMLGQNANVAAAATSDSTFQTQLQNQMSTQLSSFTGVNLDEEMSNLVIFQNAYGASARVVTTLQSMFQALMQMV
jgi:flagellar hook-associated protein 1 FlgK